MSDEQSLSDSTDNRFKSIGNITISESDLEKSSGVNIKLSSLITEKVKGESMLKKGLEGNDRLNLIANKDKLKYRFWQRSVTSWDEKCTRKGKTKKKAS